MQSRLIYLVTITALCLLCSTAYSQTDSTHYDLGRLRINKNLTQDITIKAADLEKFPFANLTDAINVWFNGTYTNSNSILYIIDGNAINNVDAYNIHDIDEITLVQNAAAQTNGALPQQQLVLIKTKRSHLNSSGIDAAGQTSLVTIRNNQGYENVNSTTNLFHQYYFSGYKNSENISAGISATYLRDVYPTLKTSTLQVNEPTANNIFKFNGYADVKLNRRNTLSASVNYMPQVNQFQSTNNLISNINQSSSQTQTIVNQHTNQNLFNTTLQLNSQIVTGLTNKISGSYNHFSFAENNLTTSTTTGYSANSSKSVDSIKHRTSSFLLTDNLIYQKTLGDFSLEPSFNFSYRYVSDSSNVSNSFVNYLLNDSPLLTSASSYSSHVYTTRKDYLLTSSLGLSYKSIVNLQGGFLTVLNSKKNFNTDIKRSFPFASININV
ncbi:MAG: hypothetical protein AAGC65_21895 [Mucilaginibacter sp.]|uniref:hypothetical protein n=1 Tax=Mucilaginibacter sp. TaxID=1882438 RepID=UPI0031B4CD47